MPRTKQAALIILLGILAAGAWFMTRKELPAGSEAASALSVLVFLVPSAWAAARWLGRVQAVTLLAAIGTLAILIETTAIATGFPYGGFSYSSLLGWKLFGLTPWTVAFAWTPLVLAAWTAAAKLFSSVALRVAATAVLLVVFDLVLDPGAVHLGFWQFNAGGLFYGVPLSNFAGWLLSGAIAGIVMEELAKRFKPLLPVPVQLAASGLLVLYFWTAIAIFAGLTAPAVIGVLLLAALASIYRRNFYAFDDMIVIVDEDNRPVATARKLAAHGPETQLHRAFSVFLFNSSGELLLQQRALTKKTWPGVWSNSCCGHVMLHEKVEKAALRRIRYELGLTAPKLYLVLPDFRYRAERDGVVENEICPVLVGFTDDVPRTNRHEVEAVRWAAWHRFVAEIKQPGSGYSPWAIEEVVLLATNERFRELYRSHTSGALDAPIAEPQPGFSE